MYMMALLLYICISLSSGRTRAVFAPSEPWPLQSPITTPAQLDILARREVVGRRPAPKERSLILHLRIMRQSSHHGIVYFEYIRYAVIMVGQL